MKFTKKRNALKNYLYNYYQRMITSDKLINSVDKNLILGGIY